MPNGIHRLLLLPRVVFIPTFSVLGAIIFSLLSMIVSWLSMVICFVRLPQNCVVLEFRKVETATLALLPAGLQRIGNTSEGSCGCFLDGSGCARICRPWISCAVLVSDQTPTTNGAASRLISVTSFGNGSWIMSVTLS